MSHIVIAGDVHGGINSFYEKVRELEDKQGVTFDAILQLGDLQIYSDTSQVDNAVRRHGGVGDFPEWFSDKRCVPIPTYAILDLGRPEIRVLIERANPRFAFFGHHHQHIEGKIGETIVVGLASAHNDGGLYVCALFDMDKS